MPRVLAGELRAAVTHPAPGLWEFCTASELVVITTAAGEQIALGHRHSREGKVLTKDGLDPKWVLHESIIYSQ